MLETFLLTVNEWIAGGPAIAAVGCFVWGMVSVVLSPCHLASIPLIVAYVGGQQRILRPREAGYYAAAFTSGLFITIALVGIICALLGRMLGDVGNYWQILIGLILIWVAMGMFGVEKCATSASILYRLNLRGFLGAFVLGLAYGVLSGACTFGFIAPIAVGHCLPIVVAGSSAAAVRRVLENSTWQGAGNWFRRGAGVLIGALGAYFIVNPFFAT
jgi:cytochrome c-type biogenesis protein